MEGEEGRAGGHKGDRKREREKEGKYRPTVISKSCGAYAAMAGGRRAEVRQAGGRHSRASTVEGGALRALFSCYY